MAVLRKIFFILFALIYIVAAPLTVLYALGYIFNPVQQTLLQTGLISLQTEPAEARVWLNNDSLKEKTPVVLRNLKPGSYDLRVELAGHKPWQRKVHVEAEEAVRLEKVLLFPERFEQETIGKFPLKRLLHSPGSGNLIVQEGGTASGLFLFNMERGQRLPLLPQTRYENTKVDEIFLHPDGGHALVTLRKEGVFLSVLVEFENLLMYAIQRAEVTDLVPLPPSYARWSLSQKDSLFYIAGDALRRVDFSTGTVFPALAKSLRGFTSYARRLFVLEAGNRFVELDEKGRVRDVLLDDPVKSQLIFGKGSGDFYSIFFLPREPLLLLSRDVVALFLSEGGRLVSNRLPYFLDENVEELSLSHSTLRAAYTKDSELWTVDFGEPAKKGFFESGPTPRRIYKGKGALKGATWFYDDRYLLFLDGDRLLVQDFEGAETPMELFQVSPRAREAAFDTRRGWVYFADPATDQLSRAKIFEGEGLLPRLVEKL